MVRDTHARSPESEPQWLAACRSISIPRYHDRRFLALRDDRLPMYVDSRKRPFTGEVGFPGFSLPSIHVGGRYVSAYPPRHVGQTRGHMDKHSGVHAKLTRSVPSTLWFFFVFVCPPSPGEACHADRAWAGSKLRARRGEGDEASMAVAGNATDMRGESEPMGTEGG
ncbi:hypothetical protein LZ30DRAFT_402864 [Colletotrichum cereale]|nr:hypothetical protein LZ30DRAFT_402864 [Colletotrichum cereale]